MYIADVAQACTEGTQTHMHVICTKFRRHCCTFIHIATSRSGSLAHTVQIWGHDELCLCNIWRGASLYGTESLCLITLVC